MNETIVELTNGWVQVKVPLPFSLKWVNSYLVPEEEGYTLIDPGLGTEEAKTLWEGVLEWKGLDWSDIRRVVLTHQHPDHYGLAGYVQEMSGASVWMTKRSHDYALRLWGEDSRFPDDLRALYMAHGMPEEVMDAIADNLDGFVALVSPQPVVQYMEPGETIMLGDRRWELIDAPGHAYGAVCFYQPAMKWMVCGDQVLPHITPNVSAIPDEERDPLADFLRSLEQLKAYDVEFALPGHRDPFADFRGRIVELQSHHARRLNAMAGQLAEEPQTAFSLCEKLFGARLRENPHNLRFAMSETLAHLYHLELKGIIDSSKTEQGVYEFAAVKVTCPEIPAE
ncbi:MBL fold metallo-hydrolase [Paenibacillus soyae]|uniref:MBL fold metallo-hydrolase n=1 Tax=Paenibacillus soyae TaxID=2969249 RepID=A0A9X2S6T1_9BACL|nr:MBL fold metallo-hydrolase [Paenibacillus soyae]MCR2802579.1 MBL fold metallo-hydrolase [Paenibacillus soyae]